MIAPLPAHVPTLRLMVPPEPPPAWFAVPLCPFAETVPATVRAPLTTRVIWPPPAPPAPPAVSVPPPEPRSTGFEGDPYEDPPAPGVEPLPPAPQYPAPPAVAA